MTSCSRCVHFLQAGVNPSSMSPGKQGDDGGGLCRAHPPSWLPGRDLGDGPEGMWSFPVIHEDHRCGEWKGRISC